MKTIKVTVRIMSIGFKERFVVIPKSFWSRNINKNLNLVFFYGQNDIQPQDIPSVSKGDIIILPDNSRYLIKDIGFEKLEGDIEETINDAIAHSSEMKRYTNFVISYRSFLYSKLGSGSFDYC